MTRVEADIQIRQISEILKFLPGTENIVLCGASSYEQKYYFNQDFKALPDHIKKELQIMCVLFTEDIGGVDHGVYAGGGELDFKVQADDKDYLFDEIGSGLKIRQYQREKKRSFWSPWSCITGWYSWETAWRTWKQRRRRMRDRKNGIGRQAVLAAVLAGALSMSTVSADALAFNFGPGMEDHEVIIYDGQAANNPAYDNGWSSGASPGEVGNNPMGNQGQTEEEALSGGPNSEAAKKKYLEDQERSLYIFSTYRGGTWEKLEDGKWRLMASDRAARFQPVGLCGWENVSAGHVRDHADRLADGQWKMVLFKQCGSYADGLASEGGKILFSQCRQQYGHRLGQFPGIWYYFDQQTGVMQTNTYVDDGRYVNAEGALVP